MNLKLSILNLFFVLSIGNLQESKKELLCDTAWELKYIQVGEEKMPIASDDQFKMWMLFKKDGVHEVNTTEGVRKGKWELTKDQDSLWITNFKGDIKGLRLNSLTKEELVLTTTEMGSNGTMYFEKEKK